MEHSGSQIQGHRIIATSGIPTAALAAGLYSKSQWEIEAAGHSDDERPRHASVTFAGVGTCRRNHRGQKLLWLPTGTLDRRRHRAVLQSTGEVRPLVEQFLRERGLQLSPEKTCITHIDQGFDFLGQHLRKFDGTLLVKPSKKNTHAFLEKVRGIIDANKSASQESLIRQLNPVIRGWVNYHRHIVAADAFQRVDFEVWRRLWLWARRRHPEKSRRWVKDRYFHAIGPHQWKFAADTGERTPEGKPIWLKLVYASDTKIRRHIKIRAEANPFDPDWQDYFAERAFRKKFGIHRHEAGIKSS